MLVQKLRLQRGWSQQQLAELSGLSVRTIQRIERGQGASVETLKSLASVFEIDFSELNSEAPMLNLSNGVSPNPTTGTEAQELLAMQHVRKLRKFYVHLMQYVLVISGLTIFNLISSPRHLWFFWPAFGWGIGIVAHALSTFELVPFFGAEWEKREVEKRLGRPL
jgi:transcriptional regulator with XRE-family HTH domain